MTISRSGTIQANREEIFAASLVRVTMRPDESTEQQAVKSLTALLSKVWAGSSAGPASHASEERRESDYQPSVGIILLNKKNEIFVGRKRHIQVDTWQMPQGRIMPGEDPRSAAFRELQTQLGISNAEVLAENNNWLFYDLPVGLTGRMRRKGRRGQRQKWFAMRFKGADEDISLDAAQSEFSEWKWVSVSELAQLVPSSKRLVYLGFLEEFADAIGPYDEDLHG
ncbi:MAG TPA: RNA pyrophosphohydrolase [Methylovirgula sp.]|nr:RNA pyrophosphohydrolase [Methylovirgula sp.]